MRIDYLYIENFRCISKLEISDLKCLNVIAGINGSGKSSVLSAVKILLSWFVSRLKNPKGNGLPIQENDIKHGANYTLLKIRLSDGTSWQIYKPKKSYREPNQEKSDYSQMNDLCNRLATSLDSDSTDIMLIAPYNVNRIVDETPQRVRKTNKDTQLDMMEVSMTNSVNFHDFFIQFRELEDLENERMRDNNGVLVEDKRLKAIRTAIQTVFPNYGELKCRRSKPKGFVIEKDNEKFDFKQLSDGEKSYICLICDIARKLAITHPSLENPLEGDGVVLIDEAELHLHPSWQRNMIDNLRNTFSNCQFIMTSHSAHIVSSINKTEGDNLIVLRNGEGVVAGGNMYGKEVGKLLLEVFDLNSLRNPEVQRQMDMVWANLNEGIIDSEELNNSMDWLVRNLESSDIFFGMVNRQKAIIARQNEKN